MTEAELSQQIAAKKAELDQLRPQAPHGLDNLNHALDIELTYTSNAIEGNTLSPPLKQRSFEQGLTIGGKPLKDHLEALDHYDAIRDVRLLARLREAAGRNRPAQFAQSGCKTLLPSQRSRDVTPILLATFAPRQAATVPDAGRGAGVDGGFRSVAQWCPG